MLVLAKPIDEGAIRKLAERARGAVLLSDGTRAVIEAGVDPERELLRAAVGSESGADLRGARRQLGGGGEPAGAGALAVDVRERRRGRARAESTAAGHHRRDLVDRGALACSR